MSEETLNERVITVFNNWFLSQHGLLPQQAIDRIAELEFKAKAYDAMCDVGLIQFGDDPETRCYSVWGFGAWHHDPDILKAIAAAMEPPLLGKESDDG